MTLHTADAVRHDVDGLMRDYYEAETLRADELDAAYGKLWRTMSGLAFAGGKRLRPYLLVLAYEVYGGDDYRSVLPVAAAQELLHQSLLIHDDITDKDIVRYGVANVTGTYDEVYGQRCVPASDVRHYAESAALLAGDLLLSGAHAMIQSSGLPAHQIAVAQASLSRAVFEVAAGQLLDMEAGMQEMRLTDPYKIAQLKTASYSFNAPMECGAGLAGAPAEDIRQLVRLGSRLGEAYQLADDLLGVFGDESVTGKSNLTDLQEGKHTYLMQLTFRMSTPQQLSAVREYFGRHDLDHGQADRIKEIIVACGARDGVEQRLEEYRQETARMMEGLSISHEARTRLRDLAAGVTRRIR